MTHTDETRAQLRKLCEMQRAALVEVTAQRDALLTAAVQGHQVLMDLAPELVEQADYAAYFNGERGYGRQAILKLEAAIALAGGSP